MAHQKLTDKQQRFVEEYLIDLNATQAAIRAGYSEKTAKEIGCENLSKPNVAEAIAQEKKARSERTLIEADTVICELMRIGLSNISGAFTENGNLKPVHVMDENMQRAISSIKVVTRPGEVDEEGNRTVEYVHEVKFWDKNSALDKLAKHLGLLVDRSETKHTLSDPLSALLSDIATNGKRLVDPDKL